MSARPPAGYEPVDIRGIPPVDGKPGIRKEFTAFATDKPKESIQVSLFIRALIRWYKRPYTERLSYFQIAGIHGWPYKVSWDYAKAPNHDYDDKGHFIYCNHNLLTFPTWHRPYMALFEQTLWQVMGEVIDEELKFNSDADKEAWIKEKDSFRLPYWDWARPSYKGEIPDLFKFAKTDVRQPLNADGTLPDPLPVDNPLYRYQLYKDGKLTKMGDLPEPHTVEDSDDHPWSKCSGTSRYGVKNVVPSEEEAEGKSDAEQIAKAINAHQWYGNDPEHHIQKLTVSDLVYRLLLGDKNPTWRQFSSTAFHNPRKDKDWKEWISLEYIHNNLHNFVGGDTYASGVGHMQDVPVAAFDPIFFMHHCNIDHYFAVWQALYDKVWFEKGDTPSPEDDLPPFRHNFGGERGFDYFNSNDVKNWTTLGYQYDVLERHAGEGDEAYKQRIRNHITDLYPHTGDVILKDRHNVFSSHRAHGEIGGASFADQGVDDYVINVIYDRYGHNRGSPYTIHFFLGDAPQQETIRSLGTAQAAPSVLGGGVATTVSELPRHVGSVYTFSSSMVPGNPNTAERPASVCPNCAQQHTDGVLSRASISLTIQLYHDAANTDVPEIEDPFDGGAVKSYLADKLSWIAVNTKGMIIPWSELGNTRVFVLKGQGKHHPLYSMANGVQQEDGGVISKYSHYEPLKEVTSGKEAGATPDEYDQLMPESA